MSNRKAAELVTRITKAREVTGRTNRWLSETTGIPYSTLNRKLNVTPEFFTVQDLSRIAVALDVSLSSLVSGEVIL